MVEEKDKIVDKFIRPFQGKSFRYTNIGMRILERIIHPKFYIDGLENIPNKPVLFVANHFTRFETFIIPYIIYKNTGRQVRCLADGGLFGGGFGEFLAKIGAISTKDDKRNRTIISDLISGSYDWMIYPEGMMIKSKEIYKNGDFMTSTGTSRVRTGATVLALKSEIYRQEIIEAYKNNNEELLKFYKEKYDVEYSDKLKETFTHIVPVNITYYPIRPGINIIQRVAQRFIKKLPQFIVEELEIEGNLLLSANINLGFGKPIKIDDYSKTVRTIVNNIPLINNKAKSGLVIKYLRHRLTDEFMRHIYFDTKINLDHLFTAVIFNYPIDIINIEHLKNIIYNAAIDIASTKKYRLSYSILEKNLFKIFIQEPHAEFDGVVKLAKDTKIISLSDNGELFNINREVIKQKHDFHDIRKENTLQVIFNEFSLLQAANIAVKRSIQMDPQKLKEEVAYKIFQGDLAIYNEDYKKYYDPNLSKNSNAGAPFFLDDSHKNSLIGIVSCHGYQSSPKEVKKMSEYFNNLGFRVYGVRLKGHGTAPHNMQDITSKDWYDSMQRGYAAIIRICSKVILIGFSTGGLLSLLSCTKKPENKIHAVVVINAALKLHDIRAHYLVPTINRWNHLLAKFNITKATLRYVENDSENPEVNYSRNYLYGVNELEKLMKECNKNLDKIHNPALIIYSKNDPVVNPVSSKIIERNIKSEVKELVEFDLDHHIIIVDDKNSLKIFKTIERFIFKLL